MPARTRSRNRRNVQKSNRLYERPCHADKNDDPTRFMRREWKYNKPHLRRSDSLPTLSILPSTRPRFTCRQCRFTNTVIPMCLWCCWTSKESEALFEKSMPRARRMSAPMRISSAIETPRKRRITEANSGPVPKREVTGVRILRADTKEPTKDGPSNPVISLNRFRIYRRENPNGNSHYMSDARGSAVDTRIEIVSRKRGASCSQSGFISGAAGIEGVLSPRRSGVVGVEEKVVQKGVGQKTKYPIKARSCADISQPSKSGKLHASIPPAEDSTASVSTPSTINGPPLLPLRLRRLKEVATPLQIDSQAKIPMTHATYSTSSPPSPATTKTTRKSPLSPKFFRRVHDFSISHSPSKWPSCISDVEDDRSIMITSVSSTSNLMVQAATHESEGTLSQMTRKASTKTTPRRFYPPYSITPPTPRSPWSKSDPFGELLGLSTDTITCATPTPTFSLTTVSTIPTPTTPDTPERVGLTRPRAATVSGYNQSTSFSPNPYNPYPITPTSPSSSVYSFNSGHPPKPLYASIRKDGMYLSPLSSPRLPNSPPPTSNPTQVDRVTCDATNLSNMERLPPSPYPCSPQLSPLSSVFPPSITQAVSHDANLSSLSLQSRSSSTEGSCGGDGIYLDAFGPPSTVKGDYGGGHKRGLMARWTKPRRKFDGNLKSKVKATRTKPKSRDKSSGKEDVGMGTMGTIGGLIGTVGTMGMEQMGVPLSTSNPNLMNQRLFRVPFALAGASGCGCSMSGETELKLALGARGTYEAGIPLGQDDLASKAKLPEVDEAMRSEKSSFSREDRYAIESRTKASAGPLMKRLREMVSTSFLRNGDGE